MGVFKLKDVLLHYKGIGKEICFFEFLHFCLWYGFIVFSGGSLKLF